ncbi:MAG: hypothetical protein JWQ96_3335 [Segetibacter sp.]|nr:hypothetical protein [Segetibacter sp.]
MVLNDGSFGGKQYYLPQTIKLFTTNQSTISHRGLGFDRVDTTSKVGYPSKLSSQQTYGHTGYTGTSFWVDPKYKLVFIFLYNRVHPAATTKLYQMRTQANILGAFYNAIQKNPGK